MSGNRGRRYVLQVALIAGAYIAGALLGVALASSPSPVSLIWLPSGIGVSAVLLAGWRIWPAIALGATCSTLIADAPLPVAVFVAVGATLEALMAAVFTARPFELRRDLDRIRDMVSLVAIATLAPAVGATIGAATRYVWGRAPLEAVGGEFLTWWAGDTFGILLLTPVLLTWHVRPPVEFRRWRIAEAVSLMVVLAWLSSLAF